MHFLCFEPDPLIYKSLKNNLKLNKCFNVRTFNKAIYNKSKKLDFIRVLDNMTGSHIINEKSSYGKKKIIKIKAENINKLVEKFDLIKMDIEGSEAKVLCCLNKNFFEKVDILVEIGNKRNAKHIFSYMKRNKVNMYSQKRAWQKVKFFKDMPTSHREGTLFISQKRTFLENLIN